LFEKFQSQGLFLQGELAIHFLSDAHGADFRNQALATQEPRANADIFCAVVSTTAREIDGREKRMSEKLMAGSAGIVGGSTGSKVTASTAAGASMGASGAMAGVTTIGGATGPSEGERRRAAGRGDARDGMFSRYFTTPGIDPLDEVVWERRTSVITNPDGSTVFKLEGAEVPAHFSQLATDIVVSKYFRKAGLFGDKNHGERSVREVVVRLAKTIREGGDRLGGYFATTAEADAFEAELSYMLVHQIGAFNSPVWFNCGLWHRYEIRGSGGTWAWNTESDSKALECELVETTNAYERPQCSACFIQSVNDDLMSIYDLVKFEARLFKYGSGTGTNFSMLRGKQEKLSGGGTSSGLMSFLEVLDRAAGATKSGGTTRRAAKMVCLDMDHPEIVDFIEWKSREERKAQALIAAGYPSDFNGEAYHTVSGQNSNNSVRVTDDFMKAVDAGATWTTRFRTTGEAGPSYPARELWKKVAESAFTCADPGVQYDTTINKWHTCSNTAPIRASNPCSEYMFLDDTACNLSSLNLTKFLKADGSFDMDAYRHAIRIFFVAQEILVDFSAYPTKAIAKNSHNYRPLGLGYANLGTLLMLQGIPYDSAQGRAMCSALTAVLTGHAYRVSAEMAERKGAFNGFAKNREPMLKVMNMHRDAAYAIDRDACVPELFKAACEDWDDAVAFGQKYGYRNAQATVLAPTGTIGLLMDCDTTGIEPDFALVKFKKLAGGGYFKIVNQSVPNALRKLGYTEVQTQEILAFVVGTNTLLGAPFLNRASLKARGFTNEDLTKVEATLLGAFDLRSAFGSWILGDEAYGRFGVPADRIKPNFDLLAFLGFTNDQVEAASDHIIGRMTIEGAPHLRAEHLAVFDCANRCGKTGRRFLAPLSHVKMMAAAQPFLSGAISKTVNLPNEATVEEIADVYYEGWKLGLKAVALYRDGCKMSQPLSTSSDSKETKESKAEARKEAKKHDSVVLTSVESIDEAGGAGEETAMPVVQVNTHGQRGASPAVHASPAMGGATTTTTTTTTTMSTKSTTMSHELSQRLYGERLRLPKKRHGFTQEARVGGHKIFLRTGEYEDGKLGEIFIDMHKEGAAFRSMMNCFAMAVSVGLQHGVPLETYVEQFTFTRFEPQGPVEGHPNIKLATSIVDYIFRVLGVEYLTRYDLCHVAPAPVKTADPNDHHPNEGSAADSPVATSYAPATLAKNAQQAEGTGTMSQGGALDSQLEEMMGDAPLCDVCGHITVRNGACYRCLNCGNSMGCS
jgi:ribonucleoside-diphosphate reductase alpha chain